MGAAQAHHPQAWSPETLSLAADLRRGLTPVGKAAADGLEIAAGLGGASLWLIVRKSGRAGALALRTAFSPGGGLVAQAAKPGEDLAWFTAASAAASFRVSVTQPAPDVLRVTTTLKPHKPLLVAFWPRDLYPLGAHDDPTRSRGEVLAGQRGLNAPVLFLRMDQPDFGAVLYMQDLTNLNPWFAAVGAKPDSAVGGQWPELGYQPPAAPEAPSPPCRALPAGQEFVVSDALLHFPDETPNDECASARIFLKGLAALYPHLTRPQPEFHDWPRLAKRTLLALSRSPKATVERYGHTYVRPYLDAEVPDSMVQMTVTMAVRDHARWRRRPSKLEQRLKAGIGRFFDSELGSVRRYLPNVAAGTEPLAKDKDPNQVDSWYLYHPLANFGRLALEGDRQAQEIFTGSLDFAMKVARHFKYEWPVLFDVLTLEVDTGKRKPGQPGQSDVGGLYAYVMLQAHELTGEARYLDEAIRGVRAMRGLKFDLLYQTNLTAWGVMACWKLWRATGDAFFCDQLEVLLAGFFHNTVIWESDIEGASAYQTFLGASCLHDASYMALYECYESFAAFRDYLEAAGNEIPPHLRLLLNEYCRYAISRAWSFYPGELPADLLCDKNRNGHIDPGLAFPLEDLYPDGRKAGAVGQEIYGCGAALTFAMRSFHRTAAPFLVFCDYPLVDIAADDGSWTGQIAGCPGMACRVLLIPRREGAVRDLQVTFDGKPVTGRRLKSGLEFELGGEGRLRIERR